jgi:hypothetical protein
MLSPSAAIALVRVGAALVIFAALTVLAELMYSLPAGVDTVIGASTALAWTFWIEQQGKR